MSTLRVANAPCSWGVLDLAGQPQVGFARVLDEMSEAGYAGTELGDWGFLPTDPATLRSELARRRLELVGGLVPVALADEGRHAEGVERAVRTAQLLAAVSPRALLLLADDNGKNVERTRNAGRITRAHRLSTTAWRAFARGAEKIARAVRDATRLRTVFRHHCAGFVETPQEVETLLKATSAELLGLCLDTGHYAFGGGEPGDALARHRGRIWHVHFKDCQPAVAAQSRREDWDYLQSLRKGIFCELGRGGVPFRRILADLQAQKYDGWVVVEQDVPPGVGTPLESARRNRSFLRQLGA